MEITPLTSLSSVSERTPPTSDIRKSLRKLDRKDALRWWNAVLVIMLLMGAIVVLSLPRLLREDDPSFTLQLTLAVRGLLGLVLIFNVYTLYQQYLLRQLRNHLAGQMEIAAEHRVQAETLYEMATRDPLTGLYNRRYGDDRLKTEFIRADRHASPMIVLLLDLDNFKQLNDGLGHAAGDCALKGFAERLTSSIRASDFAVRLGGDEFLVVLPECPAEQMTLILSRFAPFELEVDGRKAMVANSHGWAQYQRGDTPETLIRRADENLYANKHARHASLQGQGKTS